jgi:uncharacterized protein (TIGR01777 family)
MKTVIAGGTGFLGRALTHRLLEMGGEVTVLTRSKRLALRKPGVKYVEWGKHTHEWFADLDGVDYVINLAGENIGAKRWSHKRKHEILQSRVDAGSMLVEAILQTTKRPIQLLQSSAIGIYGTSLLSIFDETSPPGADTLARIAQIWEDTTREVENHGILRTVIRTGVVLDEHEGALARMLLPFRFFIGGPLGSGRQWLSWIHLNDYINAIIHLITHHLDGVYNLTAPNPVRNREMGLTIAETLSRPYWIPVPEFALRLLFGEMSTLVLDGQKVMPTRLIESGFEFKYPLISLALQDILNPGKAAIV